MQSNTIECHYQNIIIVGCGGVGSWLAHLLVRLLPKLEPVPMFILQDGDRLEEKNLDRQLFSVDDVGKNKAEALALKYVTEHPTVDYEPSYFHDQIELPPNTLVICCADNHPARSYCLSACDESAVYGNLAHCIIAANEVTDAEAYLYLPSWRNTPADPRRYYPEILTDTSDDPTGRVNCATLIQSGTPQLALANYMAAGQAAYLFWFLLTQARLLQGEDEQLWPVRHYNSLFRFSTMRKDALPPLPQQQQTTTERIEHGHNTTDAGASAAAIGATSVT